MDQKKYQYHFRPGYGSDDFLFEFFIDLNDIKFFRDDLMNAIVEINPNVLEQINLYNFESTTFEFNSTLGKFSIAEDCWGFVFIISDNNQKCLLKINDLLESDKRFEKIEIDN